MQVVPHEELWGSEQGLISFTPVMLVSVESLQVQTRIIQANRGFCFHPLEGRHPEMDESKWTTACSFFFRHWRVMLWSLKSQLRTSEMNSFQDYQDVRMEFGFPVIAGMFCWQFCRPWLHWPPAALLLISLNSSEGRYHFADQSRAFKLSHIS